jgi:outer membrane biosynthesis protein TonB
MTERDEKKNKRIAAITSIGIHVVVFLVFLFAIAWRAPDPPLPEYGIELNFGLDNQGSGNIQPDAHAGSANPSQEEVNQSENEIPQEEDQPEVSEKTTPQETKPAEQPVITKQESPVAIKEEKKAETKPVEKKEQPK